MIQTEEKSSPDKEVRDAIEGILFNPKELTQLKDVIAQFSRGEITITQFKEHILHSRLTMQQLLIDFYPFYLNYKNDHGKRTTPVNTDSILATENQKLNHELQKHKQLLNDVVPRIIRLEQQLTPETEVPQNKAMTLEYAINMAVKNVHFEDWLLAFQVDAQGQVLREDYYFILSMFTAIKEYYVKVFSIADTENLYIKTIIYSLPITQELKAELRRLWDIRNNLSHKFHGLSADVIESMYTSYFSVIFQLLWSLLDATIKKQYREEIITYITQVITTIFEMHPYLTTIGHKLIKSTF